jgi:hypothetical protein
MSSNLPYNGNLQEAIKHRDREAVKQLMSLREFNSEEKDNSNPGGDSKFNVSELVEALTSLGFSSRQIHDFIQGTKLEGDSHVPEEEQCADFLEEAAGVKSLFDYSDRHFPIPKRKNKQQTKLETIPIDTFNNAQRVTPHMLRGMDVDFTWTLMQTCIDNPEISQLDCYEVLQSIQVLVGGDILSGYATSFLRNSLIAGYLLEVKCVADTLELLVTPEVGFSSPGSSPLRRNRTRTRSTGTPTSTAPSPLSTEKTALLSSENVNFEFDGADSDSAVMHALTEEDDDALLQSYICPITREILVEPITLQVRACTRVQVCAQ